MAKARIMQHLVCAECETGYVLKFGNDGKDHYFVHPIMIGSGQKCPESGKTYKIPIATVDLEEYE